MIEDLNEENRFVLGMWLKIWMPITIGISLIAEYEFSFTFGYIIIGLPASIIIVAMIYAVDEGLKDE